MESAVCKICGGEGLIRIDDLNTKMCLCAYARAMLGHLGPEIGGAKPLTESPLFVRGASREVPAEFDASTQNLFLKGKWIDVLPHFKYVLCLKGLDFRTVVTTDERIRSIFVGNEQYKAVMRSKREEVDTYNGLADFVTGPHLLIIRLGFLGYKNAAMPGALKEALLHREVQRRPTWLLEVPTSLFGPGHFSYNDDVGTYIESNFKVLDLTRDPDEIPIEAPHGVDLPEADTVSMGDYDPEIIKVQHTHQPKPRFIQPEEGSIDSMMGGDNSYKKPPKKKPFKKGGGSSGNDMSGDFE